MGSESANQLATLNSMDCFGTSSRSCLEWNSDKKASRMMLHGERQTLNEVWTFWICENAST